MIDLFVDDVRQCPLIGWTVVRTIEEAKDLLASGVVRKLSS